MREQSRENQRNAENREDSDARDRAVRRPDEPGHVAAHGRDHDASDQDVDDTDEDRHRRTVGDRRGAGEGVKQEPDWDHRDKDCRSDDADGDVALGDRKRFAPAGLAFAAGSKGAANAGNDRSDDPQQGPDRGDADSPGTDKADLADEYVADK